MSRLVMLPCAARLRADGPVSAVAESARPLGPSLRRARDGSCREAMRRVGHAGNLEGITRCRPAHPGGVVTRMRAPQPDRPVSDQAASSAVVGAGAGPVPDRRCRCLWRACLRPGNELAEAMPPKRDRREGHGDSPVTTRCTRTDGGGGARLSQRPVSRQLTWPWPSTSDYVPDSRTSRPVGFPS